MKRSEMIKLLMNKLNEDNESGYTLYGAECILDTLEKAGMYPCKVEHLSGIGDLITPKGWEEE